MQFHSMFVIVHVELLQFFMQIVCIEICINVFLAYLNIISELKLRCSGMNNVRVYYRLYTVYNY